MSERRRYEYREIEFSPGDLRTLNEYGNLGWRVVHIEDTLSATSEYIYVAFMEREKVNDA